MSRLTDNVDCVVVTGAGRGIGAAAAKHLAGLGVPLLCVARTGNVRSVVAHITSQGGKAEALSLDLADTAHATESIREWISKQTYKRIGAVLAAGVAGSPGGLQSANLQDWLHTFQVNLLGNMAVLQGLLPLMLESRFGRIITFGGGGAAYAYPLFSGYAVSKVAVVRATENLGEELRGKGDFAVVCLAPGAIDTDMLDAIREAGGEVKTTADIAEPLKFIEEFLGSRECAFNGRFVHVRDDWGKWLDSPDRELPPTQWLLRRIEP